MTTTRRDVNLTHRTINSDVHDTDAANPLVIDDGYTVTVNGIASSSTSTAT